MSVGDIPMFDPRFCYLAVDYLSTQHLPSGGEFDIYLGCITHFIKIVALHEKRQTTLTLFIGEFKQKWLF